MARTKVFQIRLSDEEFALFSAIAKSLDVSVAAWLRGLGKDCARKNEWATTKDGYREVTVLRSESDHDFRKRIIALLVPPFSETHQLANVSGAELDAVARTLCIAPRQLIREVIYEAR